MVMMFQSGTEIARSSFQVNDLCNGIREPLCNRISRSLSSVWTLDPVLFYRRCLVSNISDHMQVSKYSALPSCDLIMLSNVFFACQFKTCPIKPYKHAQLSPISLIGMWTGHQNTACQEKICDI
jgi:hypothetical protein